MASRKNNISIKNNPEIFSEEPQTAEERILEELQQQNISIQSSFEKINEEPIFESEDLTDVEIASAEQRIIELFERYKKGDLDVPVTHRFDHKEEYKQELIQLLKIYGITYITKPYYPLSKEELHLIRMDFFGRIRQPVWEKLSAGYRKYTRQTTPKIYPLSTYDLNNSPVWHNLFRQFPRFHNLEYRMLKIIQAMHIPPIRTPDMTDDDFCLADMNVYDFSDALYRAFRKTENSRDAHLFLGAKQAFIKDVFKKHETWIRNYLQRQNIHPRYINALIKAAQTKGTTNDIQINSDAHTLMCEYASAYVEEFQQFIIQSIKSDDYAAEIRNQIKNKAYTIDGSALNFLENTKKQFSQFIKKNILENAYVLSLYEQFSHQTPSYVLDDIKSFLKENPLTFSQYLKSLDISPILESRMLKNLPDTNNFEQWQIVKNFILMKQGEFFVHLLENNRSENYARFALQSLDDAPVLTDFGKDIITSFIIAENQTSKSIDNDLIQNIKENGLSSSNLKKIAPFIRHHFSGLNTYLKQNNILTVKELQNELIENQTLLLQTRHLPESSSTVNKSFILAQSEIFKNWYINFHTARYKEQIEETYRQISTLGINHLNSESCCDFIKERMSDFIEFSTTYGMPASEIIAGINNNTLLKKPKLNQAVHDFILHYGSTFKKSLLQNHLQQKETNFDLLIKKIKQQGLTEESEGLIHKFILDNLPLYTEYQRTDKHTAQQTEQIYERIIHNKPQEEDKNILNTYLDKNIYNYMIFQQDNAQLLSYVKEIIKKVKHTQIGSTEEHWLKAYTQKNTEQFKEFLIANNYTDEEQSRTIVKNIEMTPKHMIVTFDDGSVLKIVLTVHHIGAIQDSGEIKHGSRYHIPPTSTQIKEQTTTYLQKIEKQNYKERSERFINKILETATHVNLAQVNDFSNLCIFPEFWHKVMHSMDRTEAFENRERFVGRLMPSQPNIIFFGSERPEDQLCYDYENDKRTKRYNRHLSDLVATQKSNHL